MKKSDLKNGMGIELRCGDKGLICGEKILFKYSCLELSDFDYELLSNLLMDKVASPLDITAVFDIIPSLEPFLVGNLKPIWKRNEVDWGKVPIDTKVIAHDGAEWLPRYFAGVDLCGKPTVFMYGATSFTARGKISGNYNRVVLFEGNEHLLGGGEDE